MNRFVFLFSVVGLALAVTGCGTNKFQQELATEESAIKLYNETAAGKYELISTEELHDFMEEGKDALIVDAMPAAASYDKGHLEGAVNFEFPKEVIEEWNKDTMGERTREQYEALLGKDKNRTIIVYCGFVKCARSHNAAIFAQELGYKNVKRFPGGIHAWRGAGYKLSTQ